MRDKGDLKERTKAFAIRVLRFSDSLPASISDRTIAGQIARCAASANHRTASRARSKAEFISKLCVGHEEADDPTPIFVTSLKTAKSQK